MEIMKMHECGLVKASYVRCTSAGLQKPRTHMQPVQCAQCQENHRDHTISPRHRQ
jgi:hypothetical protein